MPELPEIETIKLQLENIIVGTVIVTVTVKNKKTFQGNPKLIENKRIIGVRRRAKVLIIDLEDRISLVFHLKMTGQLIYSDGKTRIAGGHPTGDFVGELPSKHTRVIFHLASGTLYFNDQRKFGWIKIVDSELLAVDSFFKDLGPEPLEITGQKFIRLIKSKKRPIKSVLMDQKIISGVGNIYANDGLWESRINPRTPVDQLSVDQLFSLFRSVKKVLNEGIKYGGATAANYVDLHGMGGHYQDHFRVYKRNGQKCLRCKTEIKKMKLDGRGTYWCPVCQK